MTSDEIQAARAIIEAEVNYADYKSLVSFCMEARALLPQAMDEIELLKCELKECRAKSEVEIRSAIENSKLLLELEILKNHLAIKDAHIIIPDEKYQTLSDQLRAAEQERDRLAAEVQEYKEQDYAVSLAVKIEREKFAAREAILVEALEFYADEKNWEETTAGMSPPIYQDYCARARAALADEK